MDLMVAVEMLVRSADGGSFSAAARQMGLTPAAVSKQVASLERHLGVQLVLRNTRSLTLSEAGARLVRAAGPGLAQLQAALAGANQRPSEITGVLKLSLAPGFGRRYVLPVMGPLLAAHPGLRLDWHFDNRQVDLIAEGFDAGISGGVDLAGGLVARPLAPLHLVLVASPAHLARHADRPLATPADLATHDALVLRSPSSGRVRPWQLRDPGGTDCTVDPVPRLWLSDPEAVCQAAVAGLGVGLAGLAHARPYLDSGALVRLLPRWWCDAGHINVYFPHTRLLPAKTRAFVDHVTEALAAQGLARQLDAAPP